MGYEILQLNSLDIATNTALGVDLSFNANGVFTPLYTELKQAYANLKNLLQTVPGDRFYHPSYGCNLMNVLFEPSSMELKEYINTTILQSIIKWLPYLTVTGLEIKTAEDNPDSPHHIHITLTTELNGIELQPVIIFANENGIVTIK
jgi:phage baseplate assembly protein W